MSRQFASRGLFQKYASLVPGCGSLNFQGCKSSSRKYICPAVRSRKPSKSVWRGINKKVKVKEDLSLYPKVYMRDVVRKISNILRDSSWESAQERLQEFRVKWDSFTVNQVLKTHPPMERAWLFFNWVSKKGFKHDQFTYTTMLDIFGEANRISSMKYVLQMMQENGIKITVVTYTSVLHWLSKSGDFDGAVKIWEEMKAKRCHPTVVSYTAFMKVLFDNNRAEEATEVYKEMLQSGLTPTCHTYTILMVHLISSGKCKSALEVFVKLQETGVQPDKAMCNILVEQFSKAGEAWAIIQILHYMKENSVVLRYPIYLQAQETLKMAGEDDMLLRQVNPHITIYDESVTLEPEEMESDVNSVIDKGLLIAFLRKKNFGAIDCIFTGMISHGKLLDSKLVSEIIEINCDHGRIDAALLAFEYSKNMGIVIEQIASLSLIGVLMRTSEFSKILQLVEQMVSLKSFLEPAFSASLIYRLGQAKEFDIAVKIFSLLPEEIKTTSVYTALIDVYFSAGERNKGIETFKAMTRKDIQAASATYTVLIRGLEMCGRADEAQFYRREKRSMETKHHVPNAVSIEEKLCDTLFAGYMVS
ncbi:pentatricopeptide repeat-containing protein At2g01390-like [Silene latifolia]|uniref:pentatricopeptide repeat-containing protein At2g01390-like n=1 Tax=Silene latifolia TaxID=37657 RepID=UPI003D781E00